MKITEEAKFIIWEYLNKNNITQSVFGDIIGVNPATISNWMSGKVQKIGGRSVGALIQLIPSLKDAFKESLEEQKEEPKKKNQQVKSQKEELNNTCNACNEEIIKFSYGIIGEIGKTNIPEEYRKRVIDIITRQTMAYFR